MVTMHKTHPHRKQTIERDVKVQVGNQPVQHQKATIIDSGEEDVKPLNFSLEKEFPKNFMLYDLGANLKNIIFSLLVDQPYPYIYKQQNKILELSKVVAR